MTALLSKSCFSTGSGTTVSVSITPREVRRWGGLTSKTRVSLKNVTFQKELGSYHWKTEQNEVVVHRLVESVKRAGVAVSEGTKEGTLAAVLHERRSGYRGEGRQ